MSDGSIDPTVLPIGRPPFAGEAKKALERSVADWGQAAAGRQGIGTPTA